jgi:hypothetical protein
MDAVAASGRVDTTYCAGVDRRCPLSSVRAGVEKKLSEELDKKYANVMNNRLKTFIGYLSTPIYQQNPFINATTSYSEIRILPAAQESGVDIPTRLQSESAPNNPFVVTTIDCFVYTEAAC